MKSSVGSLAALGILSVNSVMAAPVSYQSVLTGKVGFYSFCWLFCNRRSNISNCGDIGWPMAAAKSTVTGTVTAVNVQWVQTFLVIKSLSLRK